MFVSYLKQLVLARWNKIRRMGFSLHRYALKSMGYEVEYQPFQVPEVGFIESPYQQNVIGKLLMH